MRKTKTNTITARSRKGVVQQVFIFITALVVVVATVFVAGKFIVKLLNTSCDASVETFKNDILQNVELYDTYGTRKTVNMPVPCNAKGVCFVDSGIIENMRDGDSSNNPANFNPSNVFIKDKVDAGVENNIFIITDDKVLDAGYSKKIVLDDSIRNTDVLCINDSGTGVFKIRFLGMGATVKIEQG